MNVSHLAPSLSPLQGFIHWADLFPGARAPGYSLAPLLGLHNVRSTVAAGLVAPLRRARAAARAQECCRLVRVPGGAANLHREPGRR